MYGWSNAPGVAKVADVVLLDPLTSVRDVVEAVTNASVHDKSQSPAVSDIDVIFAAVTVVNDTAEPLVTVDEITSPTLPAAALSFVVVPTKFAWFIVGVVALTDSPDPVMSLAAATYSTTFHTLAPVPDVALLCTIKVVLAAIACTVLVPELCTVTTPEDRLVIVYRVPKASVDTTGSLQVCVVAPVNTCCLLLPTTKVVVPAAVAVEVYPSKKLAADKLLFASHRAMPDADGVALGVALAQFVPLDCIILPEVPGVA